MECRICGNNENNQSYFPREMMYGTREVFEYFKCGACGCLQIKEIPVDLGKYYPNNYYSFKKPKSQNAILEWVERIARHERAKYALGHETILSKVAAKLKPPRAIYKWIKKCNVNFNSRILDVGSGAGTLVSSLYKDGFKNVIGADPFIEKPILYKDRVLVEKKEISEMTGQYDLILFNYSLEHIASQIDSLKSAYNLLAPNGVVLLRIPSVDSYAFKTFENDWAHLDAPRHLYLYSLKSVDVLVQKTGLKIREKIFDSNAFSMWASMQYKKDIPLYAENSYNVNPECSLFKKEDIKNFKRQVKELDARGEGDLINVFLEK